MHNHRVSPKHDCWSRPHPNTRLRAAGPFRRSNLRTEYDPMSEERIAWRNADQILLRLLGRRKYIANSIQHKSSCRHRVLDVSIVPRTFFLSRTEAALEHALTAVSAA